MKKNIQIILTVIFLAAFLQGQQSKDYGQNSLKNYEIHQYMVTIGGSPQSIIKLDNNSEILFKCINGISEEKLKQSGVVFNSSQIRLLSNWRLLNSQDDILHTNFPILNQSQTKLLRRKAKSIALELSKYLGDDIIKLKQQLKSLNRTNNIYSILFSYVIDGIAWKIFEQRGLIDKREVTGEKPFWDGEIWATNPKRDFLCGTNTMSDQGVKLITNWSPKTIKNMIPFVADWNTLSKILDDYIKYNRVKDDNAKKVFGPYNLFNEQGEITIPVIEEKKTNDLFVICNNIADIIAENVTKMIDLKSLTREFKFKDSKQTLIIVYHELMWELLDALEKEGLITKPIAFSDPNNTNPNDIANLIFLVRTNKE